MTEILTKSEFAELCNLSPGRVSQMLSEGKIGPEALVGEGRRAKINVAIAQQQIRERTDVGQRLGNGLATDLGDVQVPLTSPDLPLEKSTTDKIAEQKLRQAEIETRRREAEELQDQGVLTTTIAARAAIAQAVATNVREFEGALVDMASRISSDFSLNQRDVLHTLRSEFAAIRAKVSEKSTAKRDATPRTTEIPDILELEGAAG